MVCEVAFDSNIVLYLLSSDARKSAIAAELISKKGVISVQVLNETAHVMRRKTKADWKAIETFADALISICVVRPLTLEIQQHGLKIAKRYQLGIYDAMIVASAIEAGCKTLYSEDMHDGLQIEGLKVCNPFNLN